jgi:hypothetical protein
MAEQNAQSGPYANFLVGAAETALADTRDPNEIYDEVFQLLFRRYTTEQAMKLATLVRALREALTFTVERNIEDRAQRTTLHDFNAGAISKDGKIQPEALASAFTSGQQSGRERRSLREALGDGLSPEHFLREVVKALQEDGRSESEILDHLSTQELWTIRSLGNEAKEIIESRVTETN